MLLNLYTFTLAIAFIPNIVGAATAPRWVLASVAVCWIKLWPALFTAYCFAVLDFDDAVHWAIICGAFSYGLSFKGSLEPILRALACGLAISGLLAFGQKFFGFDLLPQAVAPGGLFLNKNVMGEAAALILILCIRHKQWVSIGLVIPALILSGSKAAMIAAMIGSWLLLPSYWRLAPLGLLPFLWLSSWDWWQSFEIRFVLWREALSQLTLFGNGSWFASRYIRGADQVHNDWVQSAYELGVVGLLPLVVLFFAAERELALVATVIVLGSFAFPLHMPFTAVFGAFFVGRALVSQSALGRVPLHFGHARGAA